MDTNLEIEENLEGLLKVISMNIWHRLRFMHTVPGIRFNEVTLTQELVFGIYAAAISKKFPARIYQSTNEDVNGNDLEIVIETRDGWLKIPCQVKVIGRGEKYPKLKYKKMATIK